MARLLIHVEGVAEETCVNEILAPHLYGRGYDKVAARLVGNSRQRDHRGGIKAWAAVRSDILGHLMDDPGCVATTMVDYYGLPQHGVKAWPGRQAAASLPFLMKASTIEDALLNDVCQQLGTGFNPSRFIPYVMMHEFEGLLFSDCAAFGQGIGRPELAPSFQQVRNGFATPEEINDSPITAPSKRVEALVPGYEKPLMGALAILQIGLDVIREQCVHFRQWLERLEALPR